MIVQGTMMSDFSAVKTYFTNYARQRAFQTPLPPLATSPPSPAEMDAALGAVLAVAKIGDVGLGNATKVVTAVPPPLTRNSLCVT